MKKVKLFNNVTSLYKLNYKCGNCNIWIKRDDNIDFGFGGNKVRLYEYIAQYIIDSNVDRVVTYGSSLSNYLRVTAVVCSKLGIECDLIILDDENSKKQGGNSFLLKNFDANIIHCKYEDASQFIDIYKYSLEQKNIKYLWIPGGGHLPEAAFGYVDASKEIIKQLSENQCTIDAVFLPCGTGTTQAGLAYGFAGTNTEIIGVTIARTIERCNEEIDDILRGMEKIDIYEPTKKYNYCVIENDGSKYGEKNNNIDELIKEIAISDGIFLDPIYNAKAFMGMKKELERQQKYKNVLYINTGGTPNIFANSGA